VNQRAPGPASAWTWISEPETKARLADKGVAIPLGRVADTADDAAKAARELRPPFVVKVVAPGVVHKTDVGGVRLGLMTVDDVRQAAAEMIDAAAGVRVLVEEQQVSAVEVIVGARSTDGFGPVVMVGLGGLWVEQLGDLSFGFAPLSAGDAERMLRRLRAWPALAGGRGQAPVNIDALRRLLVAVGELAMSYSDMRFEIDLNPVLAGPDGAVAVDASIATAPDATTRDGAPPPGGLDRLFSPGVVAVVGADPKSPTLGNLLLTEYRRVGRAELLAVHPEAVERSGLEGIAWRSTIADVGPVDLLSVTVAPHLGAATMSTLPPNPGGIVHLFTGPPTADPKSGVNGRKTCCRRRGLRVGECSVLTRWACTASRVVFPLFPGRH
jgi:acyl-CoA synthetase (NDP forming)